MAGGCFDVASPPESERGIFLVVLQYLANDWPFDIYNVIIYNTVFFEILFKVISNCGLKTTQATCASYYPQVSLTPTLTTDNPFLFLLTPKHPTNQKNKSCCAAKPCPASSAVSFPTVLSPPLSFAPAPLCPSLHMAKEEFCQTC